MSHCHCQCHSSCCSSHDCHSQEGSCHDHSAAQGGECDFPHRFLELADEAWMEVLKDKIKEHISKDAKHMEELAQIISEANKERWRAKMEKQQRCNSYGEKLREHFHIACGSNCKG